MFFFFKQKTAYEMRISDGSSDVCSADLGVVLAAKQLAERDEDLAAVDRAVLERRVEREVAAADVHAVGVARHQRDGDADVVGVADQAVRVIQTEGQADDRRHRRQGDVALVEGELDAEHAGAVPLALADDAVRSEEHTSELQSLMRTSYAVLC